MNLGEFLERRFASRWLFIVVGLTLFALIILRFKVLSHFWVASSPLGPFDTTAPNIISYAIDSAVDTLFAVLFAALFIIFLIPRELREGKILTIHPKDIGAELERPLSDTTEYLFRGRSARYFRTNVLPILADQARSQSRTRSIWILLPDPADVRLMENYAFYRNGISFRGDKKPWSVWDIQREILATIIAVAHQHAINPHIDARVGTLSSYSLVRVDMSAKSAILTREDPKAPAFKCFCDTVFYDSYREEIIQGIDQGTTIDLEGVWTRGNPLNDANVATAMTALNFATQATDSDLVKEVLDAAARPKNPYA